MTVKALNEPEAEMPKADETKPEAEEPPVKPKCEERRYDASITGEACE